MSPLQDASPPWRSLPCPGVGHQPGELWVLRQYLWGGLIVRKIFRWIL